MNQNVNQDVITFSFGENWKSYVQTVTEDSVLGAMKDIETWLGRESVADKTVLDLGCGSGIHSLCFYMLGAKSVVSLDADRRSVESTRILWEKAGGPPNWKIVEGSILDAEFVATLGRHEVVYSWGVLHHTGSMWEAIKNAGSLVAPGGLLWISIYAKGPKYPEHLALKQTYNRASFLGKKLIVWKEIYKMMRLRVSWRQNPFAWNEKRERGMDVYHDLVDWLGGLPYEVASTDEIIEFCQDRWLILEKMNEVPEGGCSSYLFSVASEQSA